MNVIYSTLTNDVAYSFYDQKSPNDLKPLLFRILIKGGAGRATKHLETPLGIPTQVTDEQLANLRQCSAFIDHEKKGFIKVEAKQVRIEKAVADMQKRDKSAPLTPKDFEPGERDGLLKAKKKN